MNRSVTKTTALAQHILKAKYFHEGEESPEDVFYRTARVLAIPSVVDLYTTKSNSISYKVREACAPYEELFDRVVSRRGLKVTRASRSVDKIRSTWESETEAFYTTISDLDIMPATPMLMNAGKPGHLGMLASCFFLRIEDSLQDIFFKVKDVAWISKLGGGVGLDISGLRPEGTPVQRTNGTSSGPISFLDVFNATGDTVKQGAARRAALLAALDVGHPDIIKFIKCKSEEGSLTNFNISILVSDTFMTALDKSPNSLWECYWGGQPYWLDPETGAHLDSPDGACTVQQLWDLIVEHAWKNGEPGVLFDDKIQAGDLFGNKFGKLGVNPCSELPLLSYESCILAAINLSNIVNDGSIDYVKLDYLASIGVKMLDNAIDINSYPLESIEKASLRGRKIGLGSMGLHDMLLKLGVSYGSEESLKIISAVYGSIRDAAESASQELAYERGVPKAIEDLGTHRRNSSLLTVQPTGTTSIFANCSSGIEPNFAWEYTRKDSYAETRIQHFMLDEFPDGLPDYAKSALEIPVEHHVSVQAAVQEHVDGSLSKTCNLASAATQEDVSRIYRMAYASGCKSITVYRSGSRKTEVLSTRTEEALPEELTTTRERPRILYGATYRMNTPGGKAYITINEDREGIREVFIHISKAGSEIQTHVETEGRLISNSLKYRMPVEALIDHLVDHKSNPLFDSGKLVKSVPDAVAQVIQEFRDNTEGFSEYLELNPMIPSIYAEPTEPTEDEPVEKTGEICPECGEILYRRDKCPVCISCGFSQCS